MIISALVTDGYAHESPRFIPLLEKRPKGKEIGNLSADSGLLSRKNAQYVADYGGTPYIKPKKNVTARAKGHPAWKEMIHTYQEDSEEWEKHYNHRPKIEAMFKSTKNRFDETVTSRRRWRQRRETLLKVAAYNALRLSYNLL
jgi:transposase